jgi:hypothetical protein
VESSKQCTKCKAIQATNAQISLSNLTRSNSNGWEIRERGNNGGGQQMTPRSIHKIFPSLRWEMGALGEVERAQINGDE